MKIIFAFVFTFMLCTELSAQHSLEVLWLSDSTLKNPESVLVDAGTKTLYVSNIGPFGSKGQGFISKFDFSGKIVKRDWVTGLTSTKGLGMYKNRMYAAEDNAVVVIDINSGKILNRITIDGAQMLNDITIDKKGIVYVSDSKTSSVHKIENDKASVYLENLNGVNGLLSVKGDLYILAGTTFHKYDESKKLSVVAEGIEGGADGIEMVGPNEFVVTGWEGTIYYVKADGSKQTLSDTRSQNINAADLGYDPATKTVYIPRMTSHSVCAYKLK